MPIEILENTDLFTVDADIYAHGCNCLGQMGAGIAHQFKKRYPRMFKAYEAYCKIVPFDCLPGSVYLWIEHGEKDQHIADMFTQVFPGRNADLNLIRASMYQVLHYAKAHRLSSIAMPAIGCGIGGLNWKDVHQALDEVLAISGIDVTVKVCFL